MDAHKFLGKKYYPENEKVNSYIQIFFQQYHEYKKIISEQKLNSLEKNDCFLYNKR